MSLFRRLASFIRRSGRGKHQKCGSSSNKALREKRGLLHRKPLECKVKLLDETYSIILLEPSSLGCDLMHHVLIQLDIVERDYFSLMYYDQEKNECWIDPVKKLSKQVKGLSRPYEFHFRVKFYAIDPEQLCEELTRYHFFLQLKHDILQKKIVLTDHMAIELAALAAQSELGDYDPQVHVGNYMKETLLIPNPTPEMEQKVADKHYELSGCTPAECEISFLKLIKYHEMYGIERYLVQGENNVYYYLGLAPRGIILLCEQQKIGFYPWNRINMVGFKRKSIRIFIQNRLDSNVIDKYNYLAPSTKVAKWIWKSAIEHHSFFRLIRVIKNSSDTRGSSSVFGSKFRYSGRTFYEASRDSTRLSKRRVNFVRSKSLTSNQRCTAGYIRVGSRVFARADNGEYFRGQVMTLSDKVYVRCDDGVTLAHPKATPDGIIYDSDPDPSEVFVGSRVIAHWSGISSYLTGNVSEIDGTGNYRRYLIAFDDGDSHWNNIDQIRLLKPPMYFGPGSNSTYLQKKFSMIKTTTLINAQLSPTSQNAAATSEEPPPLPPPECAMSVAMRTANPSEETSSDVQIASYERSDTRDVKIAFESSLPPLPTTTTKCTTTNSQDPSIGFCSSFQVPTIVEPSPHLCQKVYNPPTLSTDL